MDGVVPRTGAAGSAPVTLRPEPRSLAEQFHLGLQRAESRVALRLDDEIWTYAQLHGEALRLAGAIVEVTDGRPCSVGVLAFRTIECYAGILAAAYAGCTAVPLSPGFPADRTAAMVTAADVKVVIIDRQGAIGLPAVRRLLPQLRVIAVDPGAAHTAGTPVTRVPALSAAVPVDADSAAYILFTSGSTGRPKGVPVTNANMASFLSTNRERYPMTSDDRCSQTGDCTFDLAMFDLFMAWSSGAELVSTPAQAFMNLPEFLARHQISMWLSVPSVISLVRRRRGGLHPGSMPSLRWSLFCGEALLADDAQAWQAAAPASAVDNLYGPTELTIACTTHRLTVDDTPNRCTNGVVPIGRPYPTLDVLTVAEDGTPTPGEGELCVTGPQLFPGYLNPADDAGRFVTHAGARWYRTGDLARTLPNGELAYLGRTDHQVKIRGYRVELAELEWHIAQVPGIDVAVVTPVTRYGTCRLAAWYTGTPHSTEQIIEHLSARLPEFMLPYWVRHIDEWPLNVNRKIDRRRLEAQGQQLATGTGGDA